MGNNLSSNKSEDKSLSGLVDQIATKYILTSNFQDMQNLSKMDYCNNLVILTSDIIQQNFTPLQIEYLANRIKNGEEVNHMTKDNVTYSTKDGFKKLDIGNSIKKKRLCIGIAKYYVKIAHIFSAIITTINPVYKYTDPSGKIQSVSLINKKTIPEGANIIVGSRINESLCKRRIDILRHGNDYDVDKKTRVTVNPNFCDMNKEKYNDISKNLDSEPGIPELDMLYYDEYDYNDGIYKSMTPETKKLYEKDVKMFYKTFSGQSTVPDYIKTFSQIPLKDFHKGRGCTKKGIYRKDYEATLRNRLFNNYANHLQNMMKTTKTNQDKLLKIIDKIFVRKIVPTKTDEGKNTKRITISINPKLNDKKLQEIVVETRNIITNLYLTCEEDFLKGLKIFESIVEKQILDTSIKQIERLEKEIQSYSIMDSDLTETLTKKTESLTKKTESVPTPLTRVVTPTGEVIPTGEVTPTKKVTPTVVPAPPTAPIRKVTE